MGMISGPGLANMSMPSAVEGVAITQSWYLGDIEFKGDYTIGAQDKTVIISGRVKATGSLTINANYFALLAGEISARNILITSEKGTFLLNGKVTSTAGDVTFSTPKATFFHIGTAISAARSFEADTLRMHQDIITEQSDIDLIRESGLDVTLVGGKLSIASMPSYKAAAPKDAGSFEDYFPKEGASAPGASQANNTSSPFWEQPD